MLTARVNAACEGAASLARCGAPRPMLKRSDVATGTPARSRAGSDHGAGVSLMAGRRGKFAWALFDWADAPFTTLIITFVFPAYFETAIVGDEIRGQTLWGYVIAMSAVFIAVLGPPLGAIADAGGRRKPWVFVFASLCMLGSGLLWFAEPSRTALPWAVACVVTATIGFELAIMFANAMLPDIVSREQLGRFSGWAWGLGYLGGLAALALTLTMFIGPAAPALGLDREQAEHVRIIGPLVAVWFGLFAWPLFTFTPDRPSRGLPIMAAIRQGMRSLRATVSTLPRRRDIARFLASHMIYADGLATLFAFGGIYAAGTFGMSFSEVVRFGIALNVTAGLGAFAFAWVDDRIGSRRTIALALAGLIAASLAAVLAPDRAWLWSAGCALGIFVGPVQASSRSLMARLAPSDQEAEFFGLFALSRKLTNFIGPTVVAAVTAATHSQRLGIATLIGFFAAGLALLLTVRDPMPPAKVSARPAKGPSNSGPPRRA